MTEVIIETFWNDGEPSSNPVRVRPVDGQFDRDYRIWCSIEQRTSPPVGSLFRVVVTWVRQRGREPYLRISPHDLWIPVNAQEASHFVARFHDNRLSSANNVQPVIPPNVPKGPAVL